jgi:hypothetical protein
MVAFISGSPQSDTIERIGLDGAGRGRIDDHRVLEMIDVSLDG